MRRMRYHPELKAPVRLLKFYFYKSLFVPVSSYETKTTCQFTPKSLIRTFRFYKNLYKAIKLAKQFFNNNFISASVVGEVEDAVLRERTNYSKILIWPDYVLN